MSWRGELDLLDEPQHASGSTGDRLVDRYRPNANGSGAFQREQAGVQWYRGESARCAWRGERRSEWDVLKENHRFIREDEEPGEVSWEERLARAYESKLFKEFALIDLKHYKSKRLALRWRTAPEVVDGIGEDTCGSLRCKYHPAQPSQSSDDDQSGSDAAESSARLRRARRKELRLRAFELPFVYEEAGERKEALVKVKLCKRCERKLVWKPGQHRAEDEDSSELDEGKDRRRKKSRRSRSPDSGREDYIKGKSSKSRGKEERRSSRRDHRDDSSDERERRGGSGGGHRYRRTSSSPRRDRRESSSPQRDDRHWARIDRSVVFRDH